MQPVEQRGGLHEAQLLCDSTIHVGAIAGALIAVDELIERIRKRLSGRMPGGRERRVRRGVIHLPLDETHEWDFPDE